MATEGGSAEHERRVESAFWRHLLAPGEDGAGPLEVAYGSDVDVDSVGSGFGAVQKSTSSRAAVAAMAARGGKWDLNELPRLKQSVLRYVAHDIVGLSTPWMCVPSLSLFTRSLACSFTRLILVLKSTVTGLSLPALFPPSSPVASPLTPSLCFRVLFASSPRYYGMLFSAFAWHTEDHDMHSINFLHYGKPKTWYGVPSTSSALFEKAAMELVPDLFQCQPLLLHQLVTVLSPHLLAERGVPVYQTTQHKNEFIVTFPLACV